MKNKIIITIIALIVVAGGVFAGLYFGTDLFKKDEEVVAQDETTKLANKLDEYLQNSEVLTSDKLSDFTKKMTSSSYSNEGTISMKASNIDGLSELGNIKLSFEGEVDAKNSNFEQNIAVSYGGLSIDANFVKSDDIYGIQSDLIGEDYIAIENNNLKALCEKLGVTDTSAVPDKIEFDSLDSYIPSSDEINAIANNYLTLIEKEIGNLESEKSGSTKTIIATEDDVYEIIVNILEEAEEDTDLLNMIVEYTNKYAEMSGESTTITTSDLKKAIESAISEIQADETSEDNYIEIKLTYDSNDLVEKALITIYSESSDEISMEFTSTDEMIKFAFVEGSDEIAFTLEKDESSDSVDYTFTVSAKISGIKSTFATIKLGYDGLDSNTVKETLSITASIPTGYQTASISLNMTNEITFEDVSITKLSDSNSTIINNLTEDELQDFATEIYTLMGMSY